MDKIKIMFLGAAKRFTLAEQFVLSAKNLGISLELFSAEKTCGFYPVSSLATILAAPDFSSDDFIDWLEESTLKYDIDIVIPNMDSAALFLAKFNETRDHNCWCLVSSYNLCKQMNDKKLAENFFVKHNLPVIGNTKMRFPKIIKEKTGFASRGQYIAYTREEYESICSRLNMNNYIVQDFIKGQETTVDFYISRKSGLLGFVLRDRLVVSDGEVMECITRPALPDERNLIKNIVGISGWMGCITLQYIRAKDGLKIVEINPRFGGGATCAIHCGLDMPKYILEDFAGIIPKKAGRIKNIRMTRARRDFYLEY